MTLFTVYLGSQPFGLAEAATPLEAAREIMLDHGMFEEAIDARGYVEISKDVADAHVREWWLVYAGEIFETDGLEPVAIFGAPLGDTAV